jgi:60 kDa SS-A/Ro ribonucleoprotein
VVAMTATDFSIADPKDPHSLDVVGFDSALPGLIAEFTK